jgi:hypothetical protein
MIGRNHRVYGALRKSHLLCAAAEASASSHPWRPPLRWPFLRTGGRLTLTMTPPRASGGDAVARIPQFLYILPYSPRA